MAVPGDGRIQLLLELREQGVVVGAEAAHVVPQIEEERRGVAVEPLEVAEPAGIECVRGVDARMMSASFSSPAQRVTPIVP